MSRRRDGTFAVTAAIPLDATPGEHIVGVQCCSDEDGGQATSRSRWT